MQNIIRDIVDYLLVIIVAILPQRYLSAQVHKLASGENPSVKAVIIKIFTSFYPVNLPEAVREDADEYKSFNDFFTRELKLKSRPIAASQVVSPVDGAISQAGMIKHDILYQAKGHYFTLEDLIADKELATGFINGQFVTIYLSPKDYHRIHMPMDGSLITMKYIPGRLWPVNPPNVRKVSGVFAKNERAILEFNTEKGKILMVLVGALFVGSIETTFAGKITPPYQNHIKTYNYSGQKFNKGVEIGRFNLGSTVILLFPEIIGKLQLETGLRLKMGGSLLL